MTPLSICGMAMASPWPRQARNLMPADDAVFVPRRRRSFPSRPIPGLTAGPGYCPAPRASDVPCNDADAKTDFGRGLRLFSKQKSGAERRLLLRIPVWILSGPNRRFPREVARNCDVVTRSRCRIPSLKSNGLLVAAAVQLGFCFPVPSVDARGVIVVRFLIEIHEALVGLCFELAL